MKSENKGGRGEIDPPSMMNNITVWQSIGLGIFIWIAFPIWFYIVVKMASIAWFRGQFDIIKEMNVYTQSNSNNQNKEVSEDGKEGNKA